MNKRLSLVRTLGNIDLTKKALKLREEFSELTNLSSTISMIDDANKRNQKIFKIKRSIKSRREIPQFIFK